MTLKTGLRALVRGQRPSASEEDAEAKPENTSVTPQPETQKETSMPDTDIDARLADARSQAARDATEAANQRFLTALEDDAVKANLSLATTLLANDGMSADAVITACTTAEDEKQAALKSASKSNASLQPDLKNLSQDAAADDGNADVSPEGEDQPKPSAKTTIKERRAARKSQKGD